MKNEYLRHTVATIKYRFEKSVRNSKPDFGEFNPGNGSRNPSEIINHMYHVLSSVTSFLEKGETKTNQPKQMTLREEIIRFNHELSNVDEAMIGNEIEIAAGKKLLQGPLADILTHIGQISMLQRLHDNPIMEEDFSSAAIDTGLN